MLICVTGVSGAGKSTVLAHAAGVCPIVFLDGVIRGLYAPGQAGCAAVAAAFGGAYVSQRGVDRKKLGALVFNDPKALSRLNDAIYPPVAAFLKGLRAAAAGGVAAVEAAIFLTLRERYAPFFDKTVLITAPAKRVAASNAERFPGVNDFRRRVFSAGDDATFDLTLHNGGDPADAGAALRAFITPFLPPQEGF